MGEENNSGESSISRRGIIVGTGVGITGLLGFGAGAVAGQTTSVIEWVFESTGAEQTADAPVKPQRVSTEPPGRAVKSSRIEFTNNASAQTTVNILVQIQSESGSGAASVSAGNGNFSDPTVEYDDNGFPYFEATFDEDETRVFEVEFDSTFGGVSDDDLDATVERVVE